MPKEDKSLHLPPAILQSTWSLATIRWVKMGWQMCRILHGLIGCGYEHLTLRRATVFTLAEIMSHTCRPNHLPDIRCHSWVTWRDGSVFQWLAGSLSPQAVLQKPATGVDGGLDTNYSKGSAGTVKHYVGLHKDSAGAEEQEKLDLGDSDASYFLPFPSHRLTTVYVCFSCYSAG